MNKYMVIDNFISIENADDLMDLIDDIIYKRKKCNCSKHEIQTIVKLPRIAEKVWAQTRGDIFNSGFGLIERRNKNYKLVGLSDSVTLSRHNEPIGIHRDAEGETTFRGKRYRDLICFYKIALYLNDIDSDLKSKLGGTILYDDDKNERAAVSPKKGRALIFDIRDLHSGAPIPKGKVKYLIGFRLLYCKV